MNIPLASPCAPRELSAVVRRFGDSTLEHVATYGLVVVLLAVSAFAVWSSISTSRLGKQAIESNMLSDHYASAAAAVTTAESLERKYRLEPGPAVRSRYQQAAAELKAALELVDRDGTADDHVVVNQVMEAHAPYLVSIAKMFDSVDRGDTPEVLRIDNDEVDPRFDVIDKVVSKAAMSGTRRRSPLCKPYTTVRRSTRVRYPGSSWSV